MRVTHPFHPLRGREFALVVRKNNWAEHRVFFFVGDGQLTSLPFGWTDVDPPDPFDAVSAGRSAFRVADLLALAGPARWDPRRRNDLSAAQSNADRKLWSASPITVLK